MIFIAEIGMNHNGNFGLIPELIKQAKLSGADIAKFQLGWRDGPNEINRLGEKEIAMILKISKYYDIEPMFSIISDKALNMIKKFKINRLKIASRTLIENMQLAKAIIDQKKETFVSLGFWKKKKLPFNNNKNIKYLWCVSKYPSLPWDLKKMPKNFKQNKISGFSDHFIGIESSLIAISRGANIIEKHFTLDKSDTTIRDNALSATPEEFRTLVHLGRNINKQINI